MHRLVRRNAALATAIGLLILSSAGCGSAAAPTIVTETLSGIVSPAGNTWHVFTAGGKGDVTVTLMSLTPLTSITMGVGLGGAPAGSCAIQYYTETFKVGTEWTSSLNAKGTYCVAIYDIGQVSQNVTYSLKISHP